jgi:hypothetical protein
MIIKNTLEIIGSDEQVKKVKDFIKGEPDENESKCIDFDKIIPIPTTLKVNAKPSGKLVQFLVFGDPDGFGLLNRGDALKLFKDLSETEKKDAIDIGLKYQFNLKEYGCLMYGDYVRKAWKTSENAFGQKMISSNMIEFQTEIDGVPYLIGELAKKFIDVQFKYRWKDDSESFHEALYIKGEVEKISGTHLYSTKEYVFENLDDYYQQRKYLSE